MSLSDPLLTTTAKLVTLKLNTAVLAELGTVRHISFSSLLSLQTLYKAQTSKQFKVLRCRDLTCVDVELATPRYMVAIKLSNFTHVFKP